MKQKLDLVTLNALAKQVNQHHQAVVTAAQSALEKAQLCGVALAQAKELIPHGGWLDWLAKNCEGISEATATRYMRLSKVCTVQDLESARTITQVYLAAGIIKEKQPEEKPTVSRESEEKAAADRYMEAIGKGTVEPQATPIPVEEVSHVEQSPPFVSGFTIAADQSTDRTREPETPSPPAELQDPIPGAQGTGGAGGETLPVQVATTDRQRLAMQFNELELAIDAVMDQIKVLGEQHTDEIVSRMSRLFQYGRCHGQEGL